MRPPGRIFRSLLAAALFAAFAIPAFAQEIDMESLASRVAEMIRQSGRKSAVVLNSSRATKDGSFNLGPRLSEDLFRALENRASDFQLIDQKQLEKAVKKYSSEASCNARTSLWVGRKAGAEVVVSGQLESVSGRAEFLVKVWDLLEDTREIGQVRLRLPSSKEVDEFLSQAVRSSSASRPEAVPGQPSPSAAPSGKKLAQESSAAKCSGTVMLRILITPEGRAAKVVLEKGLGGGLDEKAVAAVRDWKYPPPKGALGAIWVQIEVTFRLL